MCPVGDSGVINEPMTCWSLGGLISDVCTLIVIRIVRTLSSVVILWVPQRPTVGPVKPVQAVSRKPEPAVRSTAVKTPAGPSRTRRPHNSSDEDDRDASDEDEDAEDEDNVVGPPPPPPPPAKSKKVDPQTPSVPSVPSPPRGAGQPKRPAPEPPAAGGRPVVVFPFMESLPSGCLLSDTLVACGGTGLTRMPVISDRGVKTLYLAGRRTGLEKLFNS